MNQNNMNNAPDKDPAGEVFTWVIIFVLMFALPPIGILLLILKLRGYAKPSKNAAGQQDKYASSGSRRAGADHYSTRDQYSGAGRNAGTQQGGAQQGGAQHGGTQHGGASGTGGAGQRQSARGRSGANTARQVRRDVESTVREVVSEVEAAAREIISEFSGGKRDVKSQNYDPYKGIVTVEDDFTIPVYSQNYSAQGYSAVNSKKQKKRKRTPLEKKTGKFVSTVILLISIALFILGASTLVGAFRGFSPLSFGSWVELGLGAFYVIGGFIAFFSRNIGVKRLTRYKKYYAFIGGRGIVPISDIAMTTGHSVKVVMRDIQVMINEGYLGPEAYIDSHLNCLVLSYDAADAARRNARAAQEVPEPVSDAPGNQYMEIITELRDLKTSIADVAISDKVNRIETTTAKIFRIVEEDPSKLPQIKRFMNYYLPTTLKLLRSYALLEKQGIKGENINAAKENIGRILDTLSTGFEQQLDQLFRADAIDIAADIDVLENLMQQDGLTGDKLEMKTLEG